MKKKIEKNATQDYVPRQTSWLILLGEKYYKRMQPTPWAFTKINLKWHPKKNL
jgi:hypothetical protein